MNYFVYELLIATCNRLMVLLVLGQRVLNDYIRHYEELHYDVTKLHNEHLRAKRSVDKSLELKFTAFGK